MMLKVRYVNVKKKIKFERLLIYVILFFIGLLLILGWFGKENFLRVERIFNKSCKYEVVFSSKIFFLLYMVKINFVGYVILMEWYMLCDINFICLFWFDEWMKNEWSFI